VTCGAQSPVLGALQIQPATKGFIDLLEVKLAAGSDCPVDGAPRDTDHLVGPYLRRDDETGTIPRRQRDAKQRRVDAVGRDGTDGNARVRRIERVRLHDDRGSGLSCVNTLRSEHDDGPAGYFHPRRSATVSRNAIVSRSDRRLLTRSDCRRASSKKSGSVEPSTRS